MIRLFNSLSQRKEEFVPREPGKVGIYCCGPTVYNLVHIGNARPYVIFAVLRSWLRRRGFEVTLVENITDVDDKIINKAQAEGRSADEVAREFTVEYRRDTGRLGSALRPDLEPLATETIPEIINLCETLVARGHAYEARGSVYFRVRSFAGYGKLSNQNIEELEEGVRVTGELGKEDPLDFAVWKAAKPGEPAWDSPWGKGRPGWHIECSAMGFKHLGAGFDIHGGGRDLIFPHHENEIAQSEAAGLPSPAYWLHNGMIRSEGEKMAKSVGNIFLLREVLDRYTGDEAQNDRLAANIVLTYFLTTHYRSPLEFSAEKLDEAKAAFSRLVNAVRTIDFRVAAAATPARTGTRSAAVPPAPADTLPAATSPIPAGAPAGEAADLRLRVDAVRASFAEHMDDDLNTAAALGDVFSLIGDINRYLADVDRADKPLDNDALISARDLIVDSCQALLIDVDASAALAEAESAGAGTSSSADGPAYQSDSAMGVEPTVDEALAGWQERLAAGDTRFATVARDHYRAEKDWSKSDEIRDALQEAGYEVRDTKQGTQVVRKD